MRVSSNAQYLLGTYGLQTKQAQLNHLQEQLSTLRRVVRPSDDPVAATLAVTVAQTQSMNEQKISNAKLVSTQLGVTDGVLQSASNAISNLKSLAIQAGNGALSADNRKAISQEVKQRFDELLALANTSDGSGNYIFGGTNKQNQPFAIAAAPARVSTVPPFNPLPASNSSLYASYGGNAERQDVEISSSRQVALTEVGSQVFTDDLWQSINDLDDALSRGTSWSDYTPQLNKVLKGLDSSLGSLLAAQASVGGRQQEATALQDMGESMAIQYASQMSNLVDLDFAKAKSEFQMAMTALQTSQKTYSQIGQLSLFNYI